MSARFSGKVTLVAGGTGGLGRAVSLAFHEEGARVVVTYRTQEEFDALRSAAHAGDSRIEGHRIDVTDEAAVSQLIERVVAPLDVPDAPPLLCPTKPRGPQNHPLTNDW